MLRVSVIGLLLLIVSCDTLTKTAEYTLNRYKVSTPSMTPTLPIGMSFSVLSANSFKVNQIIAYNPPSKFYPDLDTTGFWICRVVGVPGDKLEMQRGKLFRNDEPYPFKISLKHSYHVSTTMPLNEKRMEGFEYGPFGINEYVFYLAENELSEVKKNRAIDKIELMIWSPDDEGRDGKIFVGGNRDNWGPLTVPEDNYFVLGDSRHNALDSRYLGFIPIRNIKGFAVIEESK